MQLGFPLEAILSLFGAFAGVFLAFALQRRAASKDAVDDAVERLLLSISEHAVSALAFPALVQQTKNMWTAGAVPPPGLVQPQGYGVSISFEILRLRTRGRERLAVEAISAAWGDIRNSKDWAAVSTASGLLAGVVADWRLGQIESMDRRILRIRDIVRKVEE